MIQSTQKDSGVTVVVGFILIIAIGVLASALYISQITPLLAFNEELHQYQSVEHEMKSLNLDITNTAETGLTRERPIDLRITYPTAYPGLPQPDSFSTATPYDTTLSVDGTETYTTTTTPITYSPNYNEYTNAEDIILEHSVVGIKGDDTNTVINSTGQQMVSGDQLTLISVTGDTDTASAESFSVQSRAVDTVDSQTLNASTSLTLSIETTFSESEWESILESETVSNGGRITNISKSGDTLTIELESGEYTLKTATVEVNA